MSVLALGLGVSGALVGASAANAYSWYCGWTSANLGYANYAGGLYLTASTAAANNWTTASDVNLTSVGSSSLTIATSYVDDGNWGTTTRTCNGLGQMTAANVYGNTYILSSKDANAKRMAFAHELGHALGLGHVSSTSALMYTTSAIYTTYGIYTPQSDDIAGINAHY